MNNEVQAVQIRNEYESDQIVVIADWDAYIAPEVPTNV